MNKKIALILALIMVFGISGCGKKTEVKETTEVKDTTEVTENEKEVVSTKEDLENIDTTANILDSEGMVTEAKLNDKTVMFKPADKEGNTGEDYFKFDFSNNTLEKYKYVSAMQSGLSLIHI